MGSGGSVPPVRASENTWTALWGFRERPNALFPSDLPRDGKSSFPTETSRESSALLMCYQVGRKRGKSVTRNSEATFREIMESVRMCRDNFSTGVVEHPILSHFHRVGRTLVSAVPEAPFPSDLPRSAISGSALEMIQFINVLLVSLGGAQIFYPKI